MSDSVLTGRLLAQWKRRWERDINECMDRYNAGDITRTEYHAEMHVLKARYDPPLNRLCRKLVQIEHSRIPFKVQG